jgi:ribonuclease P protein component
VEQVVTEKLTLGKIERLKSRKLIEQLFSEGNKFGIAPFRIFYLYKEEKKMSLQFGVGVSNRNFKKSVDRNRIKRMIREAYRLQKPILQNILREKNGELNLFVIYTGKEIPEYAEVHNKMKKVLDKLYSIINPSA